MEAKQLPDFPIIKELADNLNKFSDKISKAGGYKKVFKTYTNRTLSNALGIDFASTASEKFNKYVAKPLVK
jgi:hypothetical protein